MDDVGGPTVSFPADPYAVLTSEAGKLTIEVRTGPSQPPGRGNTDVQFVVRDSQGALVEGLAIEATPWMPAMGHGTSVMPDAKHEGDGTYTLRNVSMYMPGLWELRTKFSGVVMDCGGAHFRCSVASVARFRECAIEHVAPGSGVWCARPMLRHCFCAVLFAFLAIAAFPARARAQACCAGAGAITPGRLAVHEDALVGLQLKAANGFGSFSSDAEHLRGFARANHGVGARAGLSSAALRVLPRGQLALLVPAIQTYRRTPSQSSFGGGLGDINFSARYDFVLAGEALYIPGIALLAGVTFPTGRIDRGG